MCLIKQENCKAFEVCNPQQNKFLVSNPSTIHLDIKLIKLHFSSSKRQIMMMFPSIIHLELLLHGGVNKGRGVGERGQQLVVDGLQAFSQLSKVCVKTLVTVLGPVLDVDVRQCGGGVG